MGRIFGLEWMYTVVATMHITGMTVKDLPPIY